MKGRLGDKGCARKQSSTIMYTLNGYVYNNIMLRCPTVGGALAGQVIYSSNRKRTNTSRGNCSKGGLHGVPLKQTNAHTHVPTLWHPPTRTAHRPQDYTATTADRCLTHCVRWIRFMENPLLTLLLPSPTTTIWARNILDSRMTWFISLGSPMTLRCCYNGMKHIISLHWPLLHLPFPR